MSRAHPRSRSPSAGTREPLLLSVVVAACLLVQAVAAKDVLGVTLDYGSQFAALWVFITYLVTGPHDRAGTRAFAIAAVGVTAAVLVVYAV